jgi:hypothetical protein
MRWWYLEVRDVTANDTDEPVLVSFGRCFVEAKNENEAYAEGRALMDAVNAADQSGSGHRDGGLLNDWVFPVELIDQPTWLSNVCLRLGTSEPSICDHCGAPNVVCPKCGCLTCRPICPACGAEFVKSAPTLPVSQTAEHYAKVLASLPYDSTIDKVAAVVQAAMDSSKPARPFTLVKKE